MLLIHGGGVVSPVWEARNIKRGGDLPVVDTFLLDSKFVDCGSLDGHGFAQNHVIYDNLPPLHSNKFIEKSFVDLHLKQSEEDLKQWPDSKRELLTEQGDAITFESEMDRTYLGSPKVEAFLHHEQQKNICYGKIKTCGYEQKILIQCLLESHPKEYYVYSIAWSLPTFVLQHWKSRIIISSLLSLHAVLIFSKEKFSNELIYTKRFPFTLNHQCEPSSYLPVTLEVSLSKSTSGSVTAVTAWPSQHKYPASREFISGHDDTDYEEVPTVGTTSTGVNNNKSLAVGTSKVAEK
ncbi:hypothetical protein F2Q69_00027868, partial [Brassica cretica]